MSLLPSRAPFASFVLPVYNAEGHLRETLAAVHAWIASRPEPWELILVDDGSRDGSAAILEEYVRSVPGAAVHRIVLGANRGKGFAVRTGLMRARGSYGVFSDCDLAYPMENVDRIIRALVGGADAAVACRVLPESRYVMSPTFFSYLFTRHLMGRGFNWICRLVAVPGILDTQAGLKGFRMAVLEPLLDHLRLDGFSFDVEWLRALQDSRARIEEVPVSFRYDSEPSTVRFAADSLRMARDLMRVRIRSLLGRYRLAQPIAVHADDFGIAPGVNHAVERGLEEGILTSASIMTGSPGEEGALAWAATHPSHDYGVHLNATLGRPVLPPDRVPSLVGADGRFHGLGSFLLRLAAGRIRSEELALEWEAQIARVRVAGIVPTRLDSHQHLHLLPAIFRRVTAPLARRQGLPVRAMDGPVRGIRGLPDLKGLALLLATRWAFRGEQAGLAHRHGFGTGLRRRPTFAALRALVDRTRPGAAWELVVHPGFPDDELRGTGDGYLDGREKEWNLLAAPATRALLRGGAGPVPSLAPVERAIDPAGPEPPAAAAVTG